MYDPRHATVGLPSVSVRGLRGKPIDSEDRFGIGTTYISTRAIKTLLVL